jgi:hypothetical protein
MIIDSLDEDEEPYFSEDSTEPDSPRLDEKEEVIDEVDRRLLEDLVPSDTKEELIEVAARTKDRERRRRESLPSAKRIKKEVVSVYSRRTPLMLVRLTSFASIEVRTPISRPQRMLWCCRYWRKLLIVSTINRPLPPLLNWRRE